MSVAQTAIRPTGWYHEKGGNGQTVATSGFSAGNAQMTNLRGAPKLVKVTNRAKRGNVEVWCDAFNGEVFPEDATSDKRTWLKPGESMVIPIDAALHFFGNPFFDVKDLNARRVLTETARDVIDRTGGFELESQGLLVAGAPSVRPIGGPIALPDFVLEAQDNRGRSLGEPVAIYDLYFALTRQSLMRRGKNDPAILAEEKANLEDRIAQYRLEDGDVPIFDAAGDVVSTVASGGDSGDGETSAGDLDEPARRARGGRR